MGSSDRRRRSHRSEPSAMGDADRARELKKRALAIQERDREKDNVPTTDCSCWDGMDADPDCMECDGSGLLFLEVCMPRSPPSSPRARGEFHRYQTPWCVCASCINYALCMCSVCQRARVTAPCTYRAARHIGWCARTGAPVCIHGPDLLMDDSQNEATDEEPPPAGSRPCCTHGGPSA